MLSAYPEIVRAIEVIDARIASLRGIRDRLVIEFGIEPQAATKPNGLPQRSSPDFVIVPPDKQKGSVRKRTLQEFLRANGPHTRKYLVEHVGMPQGSLSYCLNDKRFFFQMPDGRWDIIERKPKFEMDSVDIVEDLDEGILGKIGIEN